MTFKLIPLRPRFSFDKFVDSLAPLNQDQIKSAIDREQQRARASIAASGASPSPHDGAGAYLARLTNMLDWMRTGRIADDPNDFYIYVRVVRQLCNVMSRRQIAERERLKRKKSPRSYNNITRLY